MVYKLQFFSRDGEDCGSKIVTEQQAATFLFHWMKKDDTRYVEIGNTAMTTNHIHKFSLEHYTG